MRIGKPTRATRSKATAAATAATATEENHNEEVAKNNSADTAQSEGDAAAAAAAATADAPSGAALAAAASAVVAPVSEVRRTPRKRSKTKLYDAVEAAGGGSKRQKRSARLASKERECPVDPPRDEEEPDDVPPSPGPSTDKSAPPLAAGVEKTVIHLSKKNMIAWIRLRREFRVQSDDKVFERLLSSMKPRFTQKKAKPKLR